MVSPKASQSPSRGGGSRGGARSRSPGPANGQQPPTVAVPDSKTDKDSGAKAETGLARGGVRSAGGKGRPGHADVGRGREKGKAARRAAGRHGRPETVGDSDEDSDEARAQAKAAEAKKAAQQKMIEDLMAKQVWICCIGGHCKKLNDQ